MSLHYYNKNDLEKTEYNPDFYLTYKSDEEAQTSDGKNCQKYEMLENLLLINERNENRTKSLLQFKKDLEAFKSQLQRTLFFINVNIDKQKLLNRKKISDYEDKKKNLQEQYNKLYYVSEVQDLINRNRQLRKDYEKLSRLIEYTMTEYSKLVAEAEHTFRKKVFELCRLYLSLR
ncbi:hypothetical protein RUM43_009982 [Polyplax serrata]|uniref:Uncharacterized protein n=1 Tax=Polyplax serrata TaxID=468196 RepID=A0AAN8P3J1_POLSC